MAHIEACIFDLDGVLIDTAKYHFASWKKIAQNWNIDLTEQENEKLKGVSRINSLKHILAIKNIELSDEEIDHWCAVKNDHYLELVADIDESELLPNVVGFLNELSVKNIKIGLGSASKNARLMIEKTGIVNFFQAIVDGNDVVKSKPDPEVFLTGARILDVDPRNTIVFEDSQKGLKAAKIGGFHSVGIGSTKELEADIVLPGFSGISFDEITSLLTTK